MKQATISPVGVLALQGDYEAHRRMLEQGALAEVRFVRTPEDLEGVSGLVIPGGESTTIMKLMQRIGLDSMIRERAAAGMPIFGTCAGLILLASDIEGRPDQPTLKLLDVTVARNAFGRQVDSFETEIDCSLAGLPLDRVHGVFIRAPYVTRVGENVEVFARFEGKIVGVRQGNLLGAAFHPELTSDAEIHRYFVRMIEQGS